MSIASGPGSGSVPASVYGNEKERGKIYVTRGGQKFEKRSTPIRLPEEASAAPYEPNPVEAKKSFFSKLFCSSKRKYDVVSTFTKSTDAPDLDFHADCFIKLSQGITAYRLIEPSSATDENAEYLPVVVCLHGFYDSSFVWADTADLLCDCEQGPNARVLVFDFYGRGRSPWTGVQCSLDVLVTQTKELLDVLGLTRTYISLIGHDMGGAVAAGFAAKYSDLCTSLTLIDPLGVKFKRIAEEDSLKKKYIGEYTIYNMRQRLATGLQLEAFYKSDDNAPHKAMINKRVSMVQWQIDNTPGYLGALLSTFRLFPVRGMEELFTAIGRHSRPVLVIWGEHDKICPYRKSIEVLEAAFPKGYIVDIRDCGHNPIVEKFDETMTEVLAFHKETYDTIIDELAKDKSKAQS